MLVYKCIKGEICKNFQNYFEVLNHKKNTRGNGITVKLPKVKHEACKKSFYFNGGKTFNELPRYIREQDTVKKFQHCLETYYARI